MSAVVSHSFTTNSFWAFLLLLVFPTFLGAQTNDTLHLTITRMDKVDTLHLLPFDPPGETVEIIRTGRLDSLYGRIIQPDTTLLDVVKLNRIDTITGKPVYPGHAVIVFYNTEDGSPLAGRIPQDRNIQLLWVKMDHVDTIRAYLYLPAGTEIELVRLNTLDTLFTRILFADTLLIEVAGLGTLDTLQATKALQFQPGEALPGTGVQYPRFDKNRLIAATGLHVAAYGGGLMVLSKAWYTKYDRGPLHGYNDSREWLQVDKVGHAWTAFQLGRASMAAWQWAGLPHKQQVLLGGLGGFGFLTAIEFLDGRSTKWGWSWSDVASNMLGSGMLIGQELAWKEQRLSFKFGFHKMAYSENYLNKRSDELFGNSLPERGLKDYNGQTYWLSANIRSFFPRSDFPAWLNVAAGYGAQGMFGGYGNTWMDPDTGAPLNANHHKRVRQWYLAPDIDFMRIPTNNKWMRSLFFVLNSLKFPAPALMYSDGRIKFYGMYF